MPSQYAPTTREALHALVRGEIHRLGPDADLNRIEVGYITDFTDIFASTQFTGDISRWDVSRGRNFAGMFENCPFDGDISKWDVANGEDFSDMFANSKFNGDVSNWNVGNATCMQRMFCNSDFAGDVSRWNMKNVHNVVAMFLGAPFDGDLSQWVLHSESDATARLLDLVSHPQSGARKHLKLPVLPVEGFRLFLDRSTMHAWLAHRASQNDIDRYHWDALLRAPDAPWATEQMRQHMQTYTTLMGLASTSKEDLPEPCLVHSAALAQSWSLAHTSIEPVGLLCLEETPAL